VVTSGRAWLTALTLGTVVVLGGCSAADPAGPTGPTASGPASSPGASPGAPSGSNPADPVLPPCRVDLPTTWSDALRTGVVAPARGEVLTVALGLSDGSVFAVSDVRGTKHAFVWRHGQDDQVVQDFGKKHPEWQVLGATFDGRYLAYRVDHSYSSFEDFSVYVWDSQAATGPVEIAHGEPDADGDLMQTPFVDPVLADGWVYWTQTRDADPTHTVLSGYRISDGHVERLSRGYGRAPARFGDTLVWADSAKPASTSSLRMIDLATHQPVPLPAALAGVRGPFYLAGDIDTLAWVGGSKGQQLSVWRSGWPSPRLLVDDADSAQFPKIAGDVVVFGAEDAVYAADLRSTSFAKVTPEYGGIGADGGPVVTVGYAPTSKGGASVQALLDTAAVGPLGRVGC
jgi:hypothetical protein